MPCRVQEKVVSALWWHTLAITKLSHPQATDSFVSVGATRACIYQLAGNRLTDNERKALQNVLMANAGGLKESEPLVDYKLYWTLIQHYGAANGVNVRTLLSSRVSRSRPGRTLRCLAQRLSV